MPWKNKSTKPRRHQNIGQGTLEKEKVKEKEKTKPQGTVSNCFIEEI